MHLEVMFSNHNSEIREYLPLITLANLLRPRNFLVIKSYENE